MKISELIVRLQTVKEEVGDIIVIVDGTEVKFVELDYDSNNNPLVEIL